MHRFDSLSRRTFLRGVAAGSLAMPFWNSAAMSFEDARRLIVHSSDAMNAEPELTDLVRSWVTPIESFYIRSHAAVPKIDTDSFRLTVEGLVERPLSISLAELKGEFTQHSATCTLTCAGNRRVEHSLIKPVEGVPWRAGVIGNAKWEGVRLSDVLKKAGLKEHAKHVWFEGLDQIKRGSGVVSFGGSIPIEKALLDTDSMLGALLATKMNDEPLNGDHGAPLRTVVPGYIGARSVKWLGKIVVSDRPSPNYYVADAYKLVTDGDKVEWSEQGPIYRFPINSVICTASAKSAAKSGKVSVAGYALPPGRPGTTIGKVEVSADNGQTWTAAKITSPVREFCWVLWSAEVALAAESTERTELIVRATDSQGTQQPERPDWNLKGYLFNGWHHAPVSS